MNTAAQLVPKLMLALVIIAMGYGIGNILAYDKEKAVEFIMHNFDKLLVTFLVLVAAFWINTLVIYKVDPNIIDKAWQVLFTILGLLTGLITGQRAMLRKVDDSKATDVPTTTPPLPSSQQPKEGE